MKNPSELEAVVNPAASSFTPIGLVHDLTVRCSHCEEEQVVQIQARVGSAQVEPQYIRCLKCSREFNPMVRGQIVGGPFYPQE